MDRGGFPEMRETLTDVDGNLNIAEWSARSDDGDAGPAWSVQKDTLRGGTQEGVERIRVDNGVLGFTVVPTRGMGLWEGRCGDVRLGWDSPVRGIVHPQYVSLLDGGGTGWLQGFGEWIARCGLAWNGAPGDDQVWAPSGPACIPLTLHGRAAYLPARRVEVAIGGDPAAIRIRGVVDEAAMFGPQLRLVTEISTVIGSSTVTLADEIHNLGASPQEFQILYHVNFGPPLLGNGTQAVTPALRVTPRDRRAARGDMKTWNRHGPPQAGFAEQVFYVELAADAGGGTEVLLRNAAGDRGVSLAFPKRQLPCFTLWKNSQALADGYVTGLEPGTNFPNHRAFERSRGRVPLLEGGDVFRATLSLTVERDARSVALAEERILRLTRGATTRLDARPSPELSPYE